MKNLIIHIGLHKTASTYLQDNFYPNLENVIFPKIKFFQDWRNQHTQNENLLLSYEGFSGFPWDSKQIAGKKSNHKWLTSFETNILRIKNIFPDACIIVVFRKHGDFLISLYKQFIQEGGTLKFEQFFNENGILNNETLSFKHRIDFLKQQFKNVYFLNFEEFKKEGDAYFIRFFEKEFQLFMDKKYVKIEKSNASISGKKLEILRKINPYYYALPLKARRFVRYIKLSPRDILQRHLNFWDSPDFPIFKNYKKEIDALYQKDWEYFLENKWSDSVNQ